jgi:poly(3-hydroxybutyrate) depolymerase
MLAKKQEGAMIRIGVAMLAAAVLAAPLVQARAAAPATGDQRRSYRFEAAGQDMPYRLYIPSRYDGTAPLPLVVALHGGGGDENAVFQESDLQKVAEARTVIVVSPLGYSRFGGYGDIYPFIVTRAVGQAATELRSRSGQAGAANRPGAPSAGPRGPAAADDFVELTASRTIEPEAGELSETDVINVIGLVRREYRIDPSRIYLMGNSMGGIGTMYLAARYPELFAAVAPSGGPVAAWAYPFARLRTHGVAALFVHGDRDENAHPRFSRALADAARAEGVDARLLIVPGGTHGRAWTMVLNETFDFFLAHRRKTPAPQP